MRVCLLSYLSRYPLSTLQIQCCRFKFSSSALHSAPPSCLDARTPKPLNGQRVSLSGLRVVIYTPGWVSQRLISDYLRISCVMHISGDLIRESHIRHVGRWRFAYRKTLQVCIADSRSDELRRNQYGNKVR